MARHRSALAALAAACALVLAGPASSAGTVPNTYRLTLSATMTQHYEESVQCDATTIRSFWDSTTTMKTPRSIPVWLGMKNLDSRHPVPPPPRKWLPSWGGIHSFRRSFPPARIALVEADSRSDHTEHCDEAPANKTTNSHKNTFGSIDSTTGGHVDRMTFNGLPDPEVNLDMVLTSKVNLAALLAGRSDSFGGTFDKSGEDDLGTLHVHVVWHAVVRPARG